MTRRFELSDGRSAKFWQVDVRGEVLHVEWGALGSAARTQTKRFADERKAAAALDTLIREKVRKGYAEVDLSAAPTPRPLADYALETLVPRGTHGGLVLGFGVRGKEVLAVGGQGSDLVLASKTGRRFTRKKSPGNGLRAALVRDGELFVAGEYGYVARSTDGGRSWQRLAFPSSWKKGSPCLFGVVEDEAGAVWTAGDGGFVAKVSGARLVPQLSLGEDLGRMRATPRGLLIPSDGGHVFEVRDGEARRLAFDAKVMLMAVAVTKLGTVVAVGQAGALWRLPVGAKKAQKVKAPPTLLTGIDVLADGQVVVTALDGSLLASIDDGAHFERIDGPGVPLWCCRAHGEGALLGGQGGLVLRWAPR
ncbi:MAG: WGR domain-containing protein [Myxococcota bacterium]